MTRISVFRLLKQSSILFVTGGLFCSLFFKVYYRSSGVLESFSSRLLYPVIKIQTTVTRPVHNWLAHWRSYKELQADHQNYKIQLEDLKAQVIALNAYRDYAHDTQEVRSFLNRYNSNNGILAQVILKNFDEKNHFFLLDAGLRKGVMRDNPVVYKNCLVGRISEVYPYYSKVTLITDASCKIAAYCTSNRVQGIHEGENSLQHSKLAFVNHLESLKLNDLIVSSGEGLIFPRGFGLGSIDSYSIDGFNYKVSVKPLINFKELAYCYVLQKGAEWNSAQEVPELLKPQEITSATDAIQEVKAEDVVETATENQDSLIAPIQDDKESEKETLKENSQTQLVEE
ncbi:rod shape-determining protein MreC [Candidatus Dependentiae bacterium]|nr:rod shape-determining protein MreC [Candidatus Dependentiae bacterium]